MEKKKKKRSRHFCFQLLLEGEKRGLPCWLTDILDKSLNNVWLVFLDSARSEKFWVPQIPEQRERETKLSVAIFSITWIIFKPLECPFLVKGAYKRGVSSPYAIRKTELCNYICQLPGRRRKDVPLIEIFLPKGGMTQSGLQHSQSLWA